MVEKSVYTFYSQSDKLSHLAAFSQLSARREASLRDALAESVDERALLGGVIIYDKICQQISAIFGVFGGNLSKNW